ncbi:MAG: prepilin-type N-terminal cleavage/methylation domain-containing protein [Proteobacteria bacterium]|nr:prepilin-type N-terminal cleavage/methylation domain-containing protein [Burkholderiales bacterium]
MRLSRVPSSFEESAARCAVATCRRRRAAQSLSLGAGFTAVELVVVIIILGVLSAVALPRLVGRTAFESRAFADQVASAVRFAQRTAIAMRRPISVVVTTPTGPQPCALRICSSSSCNQQVVDPATSQNFCLRPPALVALTAPAPGVLSFDTRGRPGSALTLTVTSTAPGDVTRTVRVEAESGYVR